MKKKSWREILDNNRAVLEDFAAGFTNGRDFERNESKPRVGEFTELLVSTGSKFPTTATRYRIVGESRSTLFGQVRSLVNAFLKSDLNQPSGIPFSSPFPTILRTTTAHRNVKISLPLETFHARALNHYLRGWFTISHWFHSLETDFPSIDHPNEYFVFRATLHNRRSILAKG